MATTRTLVLEGNRTGVSIHQPRPLDDLHVGMLYLHGGGLLYGERDDLPGRYVRMVTEAGITLVCMDYPLAPEASLPRILDAVLAGWKWFSGELSQELGITHQVVAGRSSGAYLALLLARTLSGSASRQLVAPRGIVALYGYYDLLDPRLAAPSPTYTSLPAVSETSVRALTSGGVVTRGPKALRFSLYVYARQTGRWNELLGLDEELTRAYSLTAEDVAALPPLFLAASTGDRDVPYGASKSLFRMKPGTRMETVYNLEHDFDSDCTRPEGPRLWKHVVAWVCARGAHEQGL